MASENESLKVGDIVHHIGNPTRPLIISKLIGGDVECNYADDLRSGGYFWFKDLRPRIPPAQAEPVKWVPKPGELVETTIHVLVREIDGERVKVGIAHHDAFMPLSNLRPLPVTQELTNASH